MVSATDVITYIGVPLAVLGVSPIFYTFTLALYTRLKIQRILRQNGIVPRLRARLMTGVVEVDLPVLHLFPLPRQEQQYWVRSASDKTVDGASWSYMNFETTEMDLFTVRMQRSDKITLPEAKISFRDLLYFLQDLGCYPDLDGFHRLRNRGQSIAGISLMLHGDPQQRGGRHILEVAKSGDRDGLVSLRFVNRGWLGSPSNSRNSNTVLPPFTLSGPLIEPKHRDPSLETENVASTFQVPDEEVEPSGTHRSTENRCHFLIRLPGDLKMHVSIHEAPPPSEGKMLASDHLELLDPESAQIDNSKRDDYWRHWFACAAVAVYGYEKGQSFYRFLPNQRLLQFARFYDRKVKSVVYYGLLDGHSKTDDKRLRYADDDGLELLNATDGPNALQPMKPADGHVREWVTTTEVEALPLILNRSKLKIMHKEWVMQKELPYIIEKDIAMLNLARLCLRWLYHNPIHFESLLIGSLPEEPWDLEDFTQHTARNILRTAILDANFARKLKDQIDRSLLQHANERESVSRKSLWKRAEKEESRYFCCAIVLLAIIGQRAPYLLSGQDVKHFEEEWSHVYLSWRAKIQAMHVNVPGGCSWTTPADVSLGYRWNSFVSVADLKDLSVSRSPTGQQRIVS